MSLLFVVACGGEHRGVALEVELGPAGVPGARTFESDKGYRITLHKAYLAISGVEIFPCGSQGIFGLWRKLRAGGGASAHTTTRLGTPAVISLLGEGRAHVGKLAPPLQVYCSTKVDIAPATQAALPKDADMIGKSLWLEGTYATSGGEPKPFVVSASLSSDAIVMNPARSLTESGQHETLQITLRPEHWFDGLDFNTATPDSIANKILDRARQTLQTEFQDG